MPDSKHPSATDPNVTRTDLLARGHCDILTREEGVHPRPMLRAGSGGSSDPVEILLDDMMEAPTEERVSRRPELAAETKVTVRAIGAGMNGAYPALAGTQCAGGTDE